MSMHFVVVNTFTKWENCQECININVRENHNRKIDARWTSAPDIIQHATETKMFLARNATAYVGVGSSSFQTLFWSFWKQSMCWVSKVDCCFTRFLFSLKISGGGNMSFSLPTSSDHHQLQQIFIKTSVNLVFLSLSKLNSAVLFILFFSFIFLLNCFLPNVSCFLMPGKLGEIFRFCGTSKFDHLILEIFGICYLIFLHCLVHCLVHIEHLCVMQDSLIWRLVNKFLMAIPLLKWLFIETLKWRSFMPRLKIPTNSSVLKTMHVGLQCYL